MTDQQHPITPPPEMVEQWISNAVGPNYELDIATQAANWGYQQAIKELETFLRNQQ